MYSNRGGEDILGVNEEEKEEIPQNDPNIVFGYFNLFYGLRCMMSLLGTKIGGTGR